MPEQEHCPENGLIFSACSDQARQHFSDVVSAPKKVSDSRSTGSLGHPFLQQEHGGVTEEQARGCSCRERCSASVLPVAASTRASSTTSSPSCCTVNVWRTAFFLESKGRYKRYAQDPPDRSLGHDRGTDRNRWASSHRSPLARIPLEKLYSSRGDLFLYQEHAATSSSQDGIHPLFWRPEIVGRTHHLCRSNRAEAPSAEGYGN